MSIVEKLTGGDQYGRHAAFLQEVYRGNPYWRAGDPAHTAAMMSNHSPFAKHSTAQAFWVRDDDRILATATALFDEGFNRHWKQDAGHIHFFEALPGADEEAKLVLNAACQWLSDRGSCYARLGFLYAWQIGLTIDAYDEAPTAFHTYNPPYYHGFVKNAGFHTERGLVEYRVRFNEDLADRYRSMVQSAQARLRPMDPARVLEDTGEFCKLYNEAFAEHWGAPQFTTEEAAGLTLGLAELLEPNFVWFAEDRGETVGFVYSLPDLNQLPEVRHGILLAIGVRKSHRGRSINLALAASSYLEMMKKGYESASYTVVLDDNYASRRTAEKLGCRAARNFVVYQKLLRS